MDLYRAAPLGAGGNRSLALVQGLHHRRRDSSGCFYYLSWLRTSAADLVFLHYANGPDSDLPGISRSPASGSELSGTPSRKYSWTFNGRVLAWHCCDRSSDRPVDGMGTVWPPGYPSGRLEGSLYTPP